MKRLSALFLLGLGLTSCVYRPTLDELSPAMRADVQQCLSCHVETAPVAGPRLEGLPAKYMNEQLKNFRQGARGSHPEDIHGQVMAASLKAMGDKDLEEVVEWFAAQQPVTAGSAVVGNIEKGKELYEAVCWRCHDIAIGRFFGEGMILDHLQGEYIERQLNNWKKGSRGSWQPEEEHRQKMADAAKALSDQQVKDIVAYIKSR